MGKYALFDAIGCVIVVDSGVCAGQQADEIATRRYQIGLGESIPGGAISRERGDGIIGEGGHAQIIRRAHRDNEEMVRAGGCQRDRAAAAAVVAGRDNDHDAVEPQDFHGRLASMGLVWIEGSRDGAVHGDIDDLDVVGRAVVIDPLQAIDQVRDNHSSRWHH